MEPPRRWEHTRLCALYFLHAHALGLWGVNLSNVLKAHGLEPIVPYAYACSSIAALISPLAIGALADLRMPPERVLRRLGLGSAFFLWIMYYAISHRWGAGWVLLLTQFHALWSVPTFGLTTAFILSRLHNPQESFGPVRLWATLGWMSAGWVVSWVLLADTSVRSGYAGAIAWLFMVGFTYALPPSNFLATERSGSLREMLGLDALQLLHQADHRIVFITAAMFSAVLAAFYPFAVLHLEDLGVGNVTAVMSLGQVTEIIAMLGLARLLGRFRLKMVFLAGIGFSVLRYAIFTADRTWALLAGIILHGFCFTFFFTTAQIYLVRRVPVEFRARAQALLTLMISGVGNLVGSLGFGWWRMACQSDGRTDWPRFWGGMTLATALVFVFFAIAYQGSRRMDPHDETNST